MYGNSFGQKTEIMKGKIIKINFINKGGREIPGAFDYFFETDNEKYFIKISEGNVKRDKIAKYYEKNIEIEGYKSNGLWDTDDPKVQSRVGDFIVINKILK